MAKKIAISDIHGNAKTFRALVVKLGIKKGDELYLLGDFIDRGPNSKEVIDSIFQLLNNGITVHCTKGNHEALFLDAFTDEKILKHWLFNCGGAETLASFKVDDITQVNEKYIRFFEELPYYFRVDNYWLVHAGFDFTNKKVSPLFDRKSMLWIRKWYKQIDYNWLGKDIIVHGHTPVDKLQIETMKEHIVKKQVIDIDNGCFKYNSPNYGQLCAFNLKTHALVFQKNIDF